MNILSLTSGFVSTSIPVLTFETCDAFRYNDEIVTTHAITVQESEFIKVITELVELGIPAFGAAFDKTAPNPTGQSRALIMINLEDVRFKVEPAPQPQLPSIAVVLVDFETSGFSGLFRGACPYLM